MCVATERPRRRSPFLVSQPSRLAARWPTVKRAALNEARSRPGAASSGRGVFCRGCTLRACPVIHPPRPSRAPAASGVLWTLQAQASHPGTWDRGCLLPTVSPVSRCPLHESRERKGDQGPRAPDGDEGCSADTWRCGWPGP